MTGVFASLVRCYVGCAAGSADLQSLLVLECDTLSGEVRIVQDVRGIQGTTYFALNEKVDGLYSVVSDEIGEKKRGTVVRFPIGKDGRLGDLVRLSGLPCEAPCFVSLSPDGSKVGFAVYSSGVSGVLPLADSTPLCFNHPNEGVGPNAKRQKKAYAHCAVCNRSGSRLSVADLGTDRVFTFDSATMKPIPEWTVFCDPGDGPRHVIWSHDEKFLYVLNEFGNSVLAFAFDGSRFARIGKWSTLPAGFTGETKAAAIKLTADGSVLMASNRGHDSIAFFAVDKTSGALKPRNVSKLAGRFPRDFELMPGEKFMIVGHKHDNEIQVYRFNRDACTLEPVGRPLTAWHPLCFKFASAE
jgi:6-phosphogluconolactonase